MKISALVRNREGEHQVRLRTNDNVHTLEISPKPTGSGSSVNGGELLFLALSTCYCNDIYREAAKRGIRIQSVEVEVTGEFGAEGEPATNVRYRAKIEANASEEDIRSLGLETDRLTEIQNTLRVGTRVTLDEIDAVSV
ncbi:OsmC family protein [Cohnella candidum]|uniref:OsmC family peroxiredoxin n=1 Tax=Cohnella candidum TaxID=2674991 RepID=A0A3G3JUT7_9BACL|nr:OsmC family protein [Cohnella candidum]AYQ71611.1 OsmC family peroxiredoxin [Cohnella candidum]